MKTRLIRSARTLLRGFGADIVPFNASQPDFVIYDAVRRRKLDVVLDVGANRGQFGEHFYEYGYAGTIHSFEPLPAAFTELKQAVTRKPGWHAHQIALGRANGEAVLHVGANDQTSSLRGLSEADAVGIDAVRVVDEVTVPVERLDSYLPRVGIDPARCFMKIDVQGAELDVLEGAGDLLASIPIIQIETAIAPVYQDESLLTDMIAWFRGRGFVVRALRPVYFHPSTRELMQVDLIVERP